MISFLINPKQMSHTKEVAPGQTKSVDSFKTKNGKVIILSPPTFLDVPNNVRPTLSKKVGKQITRVNIKKIAITDTPFGANLKVFYCEHGVRVVEATDEFKWVL
jgi:hypothetical protein